MRINTDFGLPYNIEQSLSSHFVIRDIDERNHTVEKSDEWLKRAYSGFMIKNLMDISEEDYRDYKRYLHNGDIYIIVHPAYYVFFGRGNYYLDEIPEKNQVEFFLESLSFSPRVSLIKAQEKNMRDFLEYASTTKRLVILILPGNYKRYRGYKFRNTHDEYLRYINEVTNESPSVLYLYSDKSNRGNLSEKTMERLLRFLNAINPRSVLIGGAYLGRCVEDFYANLTRFMSDRVYVVPELITVASSDISIFQAMTLLRSDGTIDIRRLTQEIENNSIGDQGDTPKIKNLY